MTAAVVSRRRAPLIRPSGFCLGVRCVAADLRHDGDAGLEAGEAQGQLREDQQRDAHHHQRVAVGRGQGQPPVVDGDRLAEDLEDRRDDHDDVQPEVEPHEDDGDADRLLEAAQEHRGEHGQQDQRHRDVLALHPVGGEGVLDGVGGGVGGGERHGDHEVSGGEAEQHQDQEFPAPARQQPLQHGDGPFTARAFAGNPAVHRQRAQQGHGDQDQGGQRRNHTGRERGNGGLVAQRGEVVHAGQAHDLPPRVFFQVAVTHRPGPLMDSLGVLEAEQQPVPEVIPGTGQRRRGVCRGPAERGHNVLSTRRTAPLPSATVPAPAAAATVRRAILMVP